MSPTQPAIETIRKGYDAAALMDQALTDAIGTDEYPGSLTSLHAEMRIALWGVPAALSAVEADLRRKDEALRDLIEDAKALYEEVEMAESVGTCLPDRVPSLRLGQRLAALAPVSPSEPVPQQTEEER